MTDLTHPVRRETAARIQGRVLLMEVNRHEVVVWRKKTRTRYSVPIEALYSLGAKIARREADKLNPKPGRKRK